MRILLINQFFWPDSAPTSQLLTDVARELALRGHEVHAVCGASPYAPAENGAEPDVKIHRAPGLRFSRGRAARVFSYASYLGTATVLGLFTAPPDLVITLTTPPMSSVLGTLLKTFRGSKHFIWEMDLYPDVAVDVDFWRAGSVIERVVGAVSDFTRLRSDGILVLGECMRDRLLQRGIPESKLHITENWADGAALRPGEHHADPVLRVLYSGNMGMAHEWDTIAQSMATLRDEPFEFVFAGAGSRLPGLSAFCRGEGLDQVSFVPHIEQSMFAGRLAQSDLGLVTQRTRCVGSVVPSKVYGLMAAGRPILFIGPAAATPSLIVDRFNCGWHFENGDSTGVTDLLRKLQANPELARKAGRNARKAFHQHYDRSIGVARVCAAVGADAPLPFDLPPGSEELTSSRVTVDQEQHQL